MLSVIVTNYNHARYLPSALEALLAQTRPVDELIVIDDASTDDSIAVIEPFLDRCPAARLMRNPANIGCPASLNRGLALVRGDIIYFAAADDVTYPRLFEHGLALLAAYPQAGLMSARTDIMCEDGRIIGTMATPIPLRRPGFVSPHSTACLLMREDAWFTGNTTLYRRDLLTASGGFPEDLGSFCDGYISRLLSLRHGACFSPEILGAWRRLEGGLAWSQTADLVRAQQLVAAAERRMTKSPALFPVGYGRRWARRYLFGARRFALMQRRHKARTEGAVPTIWALFLEFVLTIWWFIVLRPWDAVSVAHRRLRLFFTT